MTLGMRHKLRSETGASMSMALLLALVCIIVASIVITTGTTASGRLAGLAESDQRYYAVTSAAELLSDRIDGKIFIVEREKNYTETTTISYPDDLSSVSVGPDVTYSVAVYEFNPEDGSETKMNLSTSSYSHGLAALFAKKIAFGEEGTPETPDDPRLDAEDGYTHAQIADSGWDREILLLNPDPDDPSDTPYLGEKMKLEFEGSRFNSILKVNVLPEMRPDGSVMLTLENDSDANKFKLKMLITVVDESSIDSKENSYVSEVREAHDSTDAFTIIETRDITDVKIDRLIFDVTSLTVGEVAL